MELDLDKARAARSEAKGEGHTLIFAGVEFALPAELPYSAAEAMAAADMRGALAALLDGTAEKFFELQPSVDDLEALITWTAATYAPGQTPGESPASRSSSKRTSKGSRPPSPGSTPASTGEISA